MSQNAGYKDFPEREFQDYPVPTYAEATVPINQMNHSSYHTIPVIQTQVIIVGGCPACRIGILEDGNVIDNKNIILNFFKNMS